MLLSIITTISALIKKLRKNSISGLHKCIFITAIIKVHSLNHRPQSIVYPSRFFRLQVQNRHYPNQSRYWSGVQKLLKKRESLGYGLLLKTTVIGLPFSLYEDQAH